MLSVMSYVFAKTNDALQFSVIPVWYFGESNVPYIEYEGGISLDQQSLIGLQLDYQKLDNVSVKGQFFRHNTNEQKLGLEW